MPEPLGTLVARSAAMREVVHHIELVRDSAVGVLLLGERGTGKKLVARTIHHSGCRSRQPFVQFTCGSLPGEMVEKELFGEEAPGRVEEAAGGTLCLDGIHDLPLPVQGRLLKVLSSGVLERGGGKKVSRIRARLVATTTEDLRALVAAGKFRPDLYSRLSLFSITVPPLRERREDVPGLAQLVLERYRVEKEPPVCAIEERALLALKEYAWPGNARELEVVILGAVLACGPERVLRLESFPFATRGQTPPPAPGATDHAPVPAHEPQAIVPLAELERRAIAHALRVTGGNVTRAARALGIGRATMYRKLERFRLA